MTTNNDTPVGEPHEAGNPFKERLEAINDAALQFLNSESKLEVELEEGEEPLDVILHLRYGAIRATGQLDPKDGLFRMVGRDSFLRDVHLATLDLLAMPPDCAEEHLFGLAHRIATAKNVLQAADTLFHMVGGVFTEDTLDQQIGALNPVPLGAIIAAIREVKA